MRLRKLVCLLLFAAIVLCLPTMAFTEDASTVRLARAIYAIAGDEPYEVKLAVGSVAINRISSVLFPATLGGVLTEQHQFPAGNRYDDESLKAAHELLSGRRTLPENVLYVHRLDGQEPWADTYLYTSIGHYGFYTEAFQ